MAKIFLKIPGVGKGIIKWASLLIAIGENECFSDIKVSTDHLETLLKILIQNPE